ncbi:hypothetical protein [Sphaerospermopsis torques-reginae]|jgi:hypothetical protein|uniref:Uncharacterized protein n=1 Tax=Sphaerospermopsis torques-reginae ITEP-024 TaxID=984208 RepID=A0ABX8X291_9CYAN|nr:hypothetical protein [Sphaerospermopsis torques-reginae]QYX32820.1 hypothetical protein K2F26_05570 [Sphaerospermopsis torques-reginae ITEP-024]
MSSKSKKQSKSEQKESTPATSGGYQTPLQEDIRKTGTAEKSEARETAKPEAPGEDNVAGSPNQGNPSR